MSVVDSRAALDAVVAVLETDVGAMAGLNAAKVEADGDVNGALQKQATAAAAQAAGAQRIVTDVQAVKDAVATFAAPPAA